MPQMRTFCHRLVFMMIFMLGLVLLPAPAMADSDIQIRISDPDRPRVDLKGELTVNTMMDMPIVTPGSDRGLGVLQITGKAGSKIPLAQGQKIQVTLPRGLSYMRTPTAENLAQYIYCPATVSTGKNQLTDADSGPAVLFVAGTPHSLIVAINHVDENAPGADLRFYFNKPGYSSLRVSRLFGAVTDLARQSHKPLTRLAFMKLLADVTVPFDGSLIQPEKDSDPRVLFSDFSQAPIADVNAVKPLVDAGIIKGVNGKLQPNAQITRIQAVALAGRILPPTTGVAGFRDDIPAWASQQTANAVAAKVVQGYPDLTLRPNQPLNQGEALVLLQKVFESYSNR